MKNVLYIGGNITKDQASRIFEIILYGELCCTYIANGTGERPCDHIISIEEFSQREEPVESFLLHALNKEGFVALYNDDGEFEPSIWDELKAYLRENAISCSHRKMKKLQPFCMISDL